MNIHVAYLRWFGIFMLAILSCLHVTAVLAMDISQHVKSSIGANGSCEPLSSAYVAIITSFSSIYDLYMSKIM